MTNDITFVFIVLGVMIALFVSDRIRLDLVAIMGMLALMLSGILTLPKRWLGLAIQPCC